MSYILDALRRADAERQRTQTPALQQVAQTPQPAPAPERPTHRAAYVLAPITLAGAAGLAWWGLGLAPAGQRAGVEQASAPLAVAQAPAPPVLPREPAVPVVPREPDADPARLAAPQTNRSGPLPVVRFPAPPAEAPSATAVPAPAVAPSTPATTPVVAGPAAPARPASATAIPVGQLPEPLRGTVTRLPIGGAVHSQNRAQSFVLLAGEIVREGQSVAPGVTLEQIRPRALLLRVGAQLVELPL